MENAVPTEEGMEKPFYFIKHTDLIASDQALFALLRRYPELPTHFIVKLLKRDYTTCANRLAQLAANGHLIRFDPHRDVSKHSSYGLNEAGHRNPTKRAHRIGESIIKASTEIGAQGNPDFEHIDWLKMTTMDLMRQKQAHALKLYDEGLNPHLIPLPGGTHVLPDGDPARLYHKPTYQHQNIIDEYDRDTEPLTTKKSRRNIEEKYHRYRVFFSDKVYMSHYAFLSCMLRIVTTNEPRMHALMRTYEKLYGPCKHILFDWMPDPFLAVSYPKADGASFERPYLRVGYEPYYLNRFFEMDRPKKK
jgi:hypothetical protein